MGKPICALRRHWGVAVLAAVCLVLLVTTTVMGSLLAGQGSGQPEQSDGQAYYNNKCQSFTVQNANLAKGQIVFVGDSITDLYVLDNHYADLPLAVYNRGIGGDTTSGLLRRLDVSVVQLQPAVVVLMIGTNDINGNVEDETILANYGAILDTIRSGVPGVQIYCVSVIPQNKQVEEYAPIQVDKSMARIRSINPQLQAVAEARDAVWLELFPLLTDETQYLDRAYSDDGIHLNEAGLRVWTQLLKPHLQLLTTP